jgi:predicted amidohydrolase YtcJ
VGSRSAALSDPYEGSMCGCGLYMQPPEQLADDVSVAIEDGWHIAVHAIGDRAIDLTARVFQSIRSRSARDVRLRIEHLAMPTRSAMRQLAHSRVVVVPQYAFLHELGDGFVAALGRDRAAGLYPARSLLEEGLTVAGSSDAPAASLSPFAGMAAAMIRTTLRGERLAMSERVSAEEAIAMYTTGAAKALGHEGVRGVLRPGAVADAIVLDRDPLTVTAQEIRSTRVEATILRGALVHEDWSQS